MVLHGLSTLLCSLSISVSAYLSIHQLISLFVIYLSIYLSFPNYTRLFLYSSLNLFLSINLSIYASVSSHLFSDLSVCLTTYQSILSTHLSLNISIYLSIISSESSQICLSFLKLFDMNSLLIQNSAGKRLLESI